MFNRDLIETLVRNTKGLAPRLAAYGKEYPLGHGEGFTQKLLPEAHQEELMELAAILGLDYDEIGHTYSVKCYVENGKSVVKVYQPGVVLRKGTAMLRWGTTYTPLSELVERDSVFVNPQVIQKEQFTSYSLVLSTDLGDVSLPLYLKEGASANTSQLTKAIRSGEGWKALLNPQFPVDLKKLVSAETPEFTFVMEGFERAERRGKSKDGKPYCINELLMTSVDGDIYSVKDGKSDNSRDLAYWGQQCSSDNTVTVVVKFDGIGDFGGQAYTQWSVVCTPQKDDNADSLLELLELGDPLAEAIPMESDEDGLELPF